MSGLLYPILQVLDEEHLNCDAELGGTLRLTSFLLCFGLKTSRHGSEKAFRGGNGVVA